MRSPSFITVSNPGAHLVAEEPDHNIPKEKSTNLSLKHVAGARGFIKVKTFLPGWFADSTCVQKGCREARIVPGPQTETHTQEGGQRCCQGQQQKTSPAAKTPLNCREVLTHRGQDPSSASLRKDASPPRLPLPSFTGRPLTRICPPEVTQRELQEQPPPAR